MGKLVGKSKRSQGWLIAIAVVMFAFIAGGILPTQNAEAAGPICAVPGTYITIQAAVNDVGCATINVAAGSYPGNVVISRALALRGAQVGAPVGPRTFPSAAESTVTGQITIQAAGVTIDGVALTNPVGGYGILVKTAGSSTVIQNTIIENVTATAGQVKGIYLLGGPDNVSILNNRINNISSVNKSANGVFIGDSNSSDASLNILIQGNTITKIAAPLGGAYGILSNNSTPPNTGYTKLTVKDNVLNGMTGKWVHAVGLEGNTPGAVVTGNTISGVVATTLDATSVFFEANLSFSSALVNRNSFAAGSFGIALHPALLLALPAAAPLDGTCNWWGAAGGPGPIGTGSGAGVTPKVTFSPWLTTSDLTGPCVGSVAKPTVGSVSATPSIGTTGTSVTVSSTATDPSGLTDIYYNLFTPGGTFVCNVAHVSITGSPTSYSDSTLIPVGMPFVALDTGVGGPCPTLGIAEGSYVLAANWIDVVGNQVGSPNNQDLANYATTAQFSPLIFDKTPPLLTLPAGITLDATGPLGAVVNFTATATDTVTPSPTVVCTPASSSTFAIGTTTVSCTATDAAGNATNGAFSVHVNSASEQADALAAAVAGRGSGASLSAKVQTLQAQIAAGNTTAACNSIKALLNEVSAQTGKKLTPAQAAAITADADRIAAVLGC